MVLGLDLDWTVGDIREEMLDQVKQSLTAGGAAMGALPGGVTKRDYLDYQIRSSLAEGSRFDLIAMGRSEGPGLLLRRQSQPARSDRQHQQKLPLRGHRQRGGDGASQPPHHARCAGAAGRQRSRPSAA